MTGAELFAFVILPIVVAVLGWAIVFAAERYNRHGDVKR